MSMEMQRFRRNPRLAARLFLGLIFGTAASVTALGQATVFPFTNEWKFLQVTSTPSAWMTNDFDDSNWLNGRGPFAVPAEEPLPAGLAANTVLSTNRGDGYIFTTYFRS